MALGPKEMAAKIIQNLPKKTGKSLEEWLEIVTHSGETDKKSVMNLLKGEHGLGHFQAQTVFMEFIGERPYEDTEQLITQLFPSSPARDQYESIAQQLQQLGEDVRIQPCRTYIPFYRSRQFALLSPTRSGGMRLGMNLPADFSEAGFLPSTSGTSERINFDIHIETGESLNSTILSALQLAYKIN